MKSIFITLLIFAATLAAMHSGLFDLMSSSYTLITASVMLFAALIFAFKVLGNPFIKDVKNDKEHK